MDLCACVSEYHRDGEGADWRELFRLSYTRRYISLAGESEGHVLSRVVSRSLSL